MAAEFYLVSELAVNHLPPFSDDLVYGLRNIKETAFLVSNLSVNCVFRIEVCTETMLKIRTARKRSIWLHGLEFGRY